MRYFILAIVLFSVDFCFADQPYIVPSKAPTNLAPFVSEASGTDKGLIGLNQSYTWQAEQSYAQGISLDPANMSDAAATMLGLKQYTQADVSFVNPPAGFTLQRAVFVPYKMKGGAWRLKMNVDATMNSAKFGLFEISGVTFKADMDQPLYSLSNDDNISMNTRAVGIFGIIFGASAAQTKLAFSGDVELDSKPTWAD